MLSKFRDFIKPPIFEGDEDKTRVAALLNGILWTILYITLANSFAAASFLKSPTSVVPAFVGFLSAYAALIMMKRGHVRGGSTALLTMIYAIFTVSIIFDNGTLGPSYFGFTVTTVIAGLLLGGRGAIIMAGINILTGLGVALFQNSLPARIFPQTPVSVWTSLFIYIIINAALLQASTNGFNLLLARFRQSQD